MRDRRLQPRSKCHRSSEAPTLEAPTLEARSLRAAVVRDVVTAFDLAVLVVSSEGRILHVNDSAGRLATTDLPLSWQGGYLRVDNRDASASLARALATPTGPGAIVQLPREGRGPLLCRVLPRQAAMRRCNQQRVVMLIDPERASAACPADVIRHFGVTPRQADAVCAVAMGRRLHEIAHELDLSLATVRTHLKAAMARMGCRSQAEVTRAVLSLPTALRASSRPRSGAAER